MKYWFVSYWFNGVGGWGFGNCWVSGDNFMDVNQVQKWAKEREGFISVRVMSFQEIGEEQYESGLKNSIDTLGKVPKEDK